MTHHPLLKLTLSTLLLLIGCGNSDKDDADSGALDGSSESASVDAGSDDVDDGPPPDWCPPLGEGLFEVLDSPAAPYWVSTPREADTSKPVVALLPGGGGDSNSARFGFMNFFGAFPSFAPNWWVIAPYSADNAFPSEAQRTFEILDEVQLCWGLAETVQLMGHSAGGNAAGTLFGEQPERFSSLLLAPGSLPPVSSDRLGALFGDTPVYLGVGVNDSQSWVNGMRDAADFLESAGVDVVLDIWPGQVHVPGQNFDPGTLPAFLHDHNSNDESPLTLPTPESRAACTM